VSAGVSPPGLSLSSNSFFVTLTSVDSSLGGLTLSVSSSNTKLVPNSNVAFSGSGENQTAAIFTLSSRTGTSTATITAGEDKPASSATFLLAAALWHQTDQAWSTRKRSGATIRR